MQYFLMLFLGCFGLCAYEIRLGIWDLISTHVVDLISFSRGDVCPIGTCLKSNYLKMIGLHRSTTKKSHLLHDGITNYVCYLKV
jgi:hypothetical protein